MLMKVRTISAAEARIISVLVRSVAPDKRYVERITAKTIKTRVTTIL